MTESHSPHVNSGVYCLIEEFLLTTHTHTFLPSGTYMYMHVHVIVSSLACLKMESYAAALVLERVLLSFHLRKLHSLPPPPSSFNSQHTSLLISPSDNAMVHTCLS